MMLWLLNKQVQKFQPLLVKDENDNLVPLVDLQGKFRKEVKDEIYGFAGEYVKANI